MRGKGSMGVGRRGRGLHQIKIEDCCTSVFRFNFRGKTHALNTIPTGLCTAPAMAQIVPTAIMREMHDAQTGCTVFIDNLRIVANTQELRYQKFAQLKALCNEPSITLNNEETFVGVTTYVFLGVQYDHNKNSVTLAEKFKKKPQWPPANTTEAVETLFSQCVYASCIADIPTCN